MVMLRREHGHFIFPCFRPLRLLPSSYLWLHVQEHAFVVSADPIDDTRWTGMLYWCHCGHGYPDVVRALTPHLVVVDHRRHVSRRWFGIVVSIRFSGKAAKWSYKCAHRGGAMATYMSSLAIHACDDMAPISPQPGVLLVPFKLVGDTEARSKIFVYYNMVSKCAGGHLQGPRGGLSEFSNFWNYSRRSRARVVGVRTTLFPQTAVFTRWQRVLTCSRTRKFISQHNGHRKRDDDMIFPKHVTFAGCSSTT